MIRLVTFADSRMTTSAKLCCLSASKMGVDVCWPQSPDTITQEFRDMNAEIFKHDRGYGYWVWKPYFIYKSMLNCRDGDILIYSDAGVEFVNPVSHIIDKMDEDIFFFTNGFPHVEWCKGDVLNEMLGWVNSWNFEATVRYGNAAVKGGIVEINTFKQVQASVIFFRVNETTRNFVKEWLLYCQMPGFIDDSPSKLPNYPTFAESRHDQSILTCLAIKHGYTIDHWWPTQYSMHLPRSERDNYPVMFNHHRRRDKGKGNGDVEWE